MAEQIQRRKTSLRAFRIQFSMVVFVGLSSYAVYSIYHYVGFNNASQGIRNYELGQFTEAIPRLRRLIDLSPDNPELRSYLAYSLYRQNQEREAVSEYQKLILSGAAQYYDYYNCGVAQSDIHDTQGAKRTFTIAARKVDAAIQEEKSNDQAGSDIRLAYMASIKADINRSQEALTK